MCQTGSIIKLSDVMEVTQINRSVVSLVISGNTEFDDEYICMQPRTTAF